MGYNYERKKNKLKGWCVPVHDPLMAGCRLTKAVSGAEEVIEGILLTSLVFEGPREELLRPTIEHHIQPANIS